MTLTPLPSPLSFAQSALSARGALIDHDAQGPYLLLPSPVASELGVSEELRLSEQADQPGAAFCGLGSALLDHLIQPLRKAAVQASVALDLAPPRPGQASSLAERLALRNAVHEVVDEGKLDVTYVALVGCWVAEADDRHEGLITRVACASDGGEPHPDLASRLDPSHWSEGAMPAPSPALDPGEALFWLAPRIEQAVQAGPLPDLLEALGRRKQRDHERIEAYFGELVSEARSPRRKADPSAIEAKVSALLAERGAKLRDLDSRYALKVRVTPAAMVMASVPTAMVRIKARRRKDSRELVLRLPAGAHGLDALTCEGCLGVTSRPALCDTRLHVLCESCAPQAQGRIACPRCQRPKAG